MLVDWEVDQPEVLAYVTDSGPNVVAALTDFTHTFTFTRTLTIVSRLTHVSTKFMFQGPTTSGTQAPVTDPLQPPAPSVTEFGLEDEEDEDYYDNDEETEEERLLDMMEADTLGNV